MPSDADLCKLARVTRKDFAAGRIDEYRYNCLLADIEVAAYGFITHELSRALREMKARDHADD